MVLPAALFVFAIRLTVPGDTATIVRPAMTAGVLQETSAVAQAVTGQAAAVGVKIHAVLPKF